MQSHNSLLPSLLNYLGVSRIRNKFSTLPYRSVQISWIKTTLKHTLIELNNMAFFIFVCFQGYITTDCLIGIKILDIYMSACFTVNITIQDSQW